MGFMKNSFAKNAKTESLWNKSIVYIAYDAKKITTLLKKEKIELPEALHKSFEQKKTASFFNDQSQINLILIDKPSNKKHLYAKARDQIGSKIQSFIDGNPKSCDVHFVGIADESIQGCLVGLDLAAYRFDESKSQALGHLHFFTEDKKLSSKILEQASELSSSINLARHLVNLPPNELHPVNFAAMIQKGFRGSKTIKVEIWDEKRLAKEKCGLHLGVGAASAHPPRLVKISYKSGKKAKKKIALIGKGITFDTGGLDIKPSAGMRLMKKDMGGAAAISGVFNWLEHSGLAVDVEGYLALAENSIDKNATRPSDIHIARNGLKVEIDNTDAEGRLVLADAIDVACDHKPDLIIDAATLTGAGKVSLGQDIASLFSNDDKLAKMIQDAGDISGDLCWRMPLHQDYAKELSSPFADCTNSSSSGFGGSITAALFLQKFVRDIPWAHLDIFAWTTSNQPALAQKGGSGQAVANLVSFLKAI
ncbi:MAG: aminopeptidase [Bdellovibrionales bacterium CG12_big_fil_rev_8_21_14_0_65_38_15]|nr:MAG: aminopeptidase [Bdellovibrionales bacterium CG22_combo_CG10-13_8_21_14_all_38_13]PIQ56903.1 MAG: aminopeptidase [Bdellovibrionales bacterium CG12_big_fil_rev_8_21_14_0_65_38_15]PIR30068.1 MAG: aminopeptidase [Bdellovibrionales bacterium CG11_big_fil_rev_8_21_14_0_20_38_13]